MAMLAAVAAVAAVAAITRMPAFHSKFFGIGLLFIFII
jgi:hypothetical protein